MARRTLGSGRKAPATGRRKPVARVGNAIVWADDGWSGKPWYVYCCRDGTLTVSRRTQGPFNGKALPVWGTDTAAEAENLIRLCGSRAKDRDGDRDHPGLPGEVWYRVDRFGPEPGVDQLALVTERFRAAAGMIEAGRRRVAASVLLATEGEEGT